MSAYFSPNHNRLLDLENHLQRQQPSAHVEEKGATLSPPSPRVNPPELSGSYRQLATKIGQHHYPRRSVIPRSQGKRTKNELAQQTLAQEKLAKNKRPGISTAIRLDSVKAFEIESFETQTLSQKIPPQPSPQPSWTGLAQSIRRARLGLIDPEPQTTKADIHDIAPQPTAAAWALDEIFTDKSNIDDALAQPSQEKIAHAVPVKIIADEDNPPNTTTSTEPTLDPPVTLDVVPIPQPAEGLVHKRNSPVTIVQANPETESLKNGLITIELLASPPASDYELPGTTS